MKIGFGTRRTFAAKYESECGECGRDIERGDEAMYDEYDDVIHASCPETAPSMSDDESPCTECWEIHKGECF